MNAAKYWSRESKSGRVIVHRSTCKAVSLVQRLLGRADPLLWANGQTMLGLQQAGQQRGMHWCHVCRPLSLDVGPQRQGGR